MPLAEFATPMGLPMGLGGVCHVHSSRLFHCLSFETMCAMDCVPWIVCRLKRCKRLTVQALEAFAFGFGGTLDAITELPRHC